MNVFEKIIASKQKGSKQLVVLLDPDKVKGDDLLKIVQKAENGKVDYFFVGGSHLSGTNFSECIKKLKGITQIPVVIFPGDQMQVDARADAILFLSLISGRNPDFLIGKHVQAAPVIKEYRLETISCGYMLIDGGNTTSVQYISQTFPIPSTKTEIAVSTALAAEMLNMKTIYLEAGSGALNHVPLEMIEAVSNIISIPVIAGGGIRDAATAKQICNAGADIVVIGTAFEKQPELIAEISAAIHS